MGEDYTPEEPISKHLAPCFSLPLLNTDQMGVHTSQHTPMQKPAQKTHLENEQQTKTIQCQRKTKQSWNWWILTSVQSETRIRLMDTNPDPLLTNTVSTSRGRFYAQHPPLTQGWIFDEGVGLRPSLLHTIDTRCHISSHYMPWRCTETKDESR